MAWSQAQEIKGLNSIQDRLSQELRETKLQLEKAQDNIEKGNKEKKALQQQLTDQKKMLDEKLDKLESVKAELTQRILLYIK